MVGPSSQISKLLLGLFILLIVFYGYMDCQLYLRIQNYRLERNYHHLNSSANEMNIAIGSTGIGGNSNSNDNSNTNNRQIKFSKLFSHNLSNSVNSSAHPVSNHQNAITSTTSSMNSISSSSANSAIGYVDSELLAQINVNRPDYENHAWIPCSINPLCDVTVKAIVLDHTNHYLFAPLVKILDKIIHLSKCPYITANMISFSHVAVAGLSGKLVSMDSLGYRRLGAMMFEFRTYLDDLDGHVARAKKNIRGERSEVGTTGYYIDGICDALGCIALLMGMYIYLKNNPPRRGYVPLPVADPRSLEANLPAVSNGKGKLKPTNRKLAEKVICFTGQLLLSSMAWNRYIAVYQEMLESNDVIPIQMLRQEIVFRSTWWFCIAWLWRIINVHALLHYVLLSIFCDKLWEFLRSIQYIGYLVLLLAICLTEMHQLETYNYIFGEQFTTTASINNTVI